MAKYSLIQLLISYIAGILLASIIDIDFGHWFFVGQFAFLLLLLFFHLKNKRKPFVTILYLLFFSIGYFNISKSSDINQENHFSNYITENIESSFECKLVDWPVETRKYFKVKAKVLKSNLNNDEVSGFITLFFTKGNLSASLKKGQSISFIGDIQLEEGIKYLAFLDDNWEKIPTESYLFKISSINDNSLKRFSELKESEYALVGGLVFGRRDLLSFEMKQDYQKSGMMHLLAISGLHVGIVYLFISWLLGFMNFSAKQRRIKSIIIIGTLIFYAAFTGFSPSVSRAVLMFSLFAFGDLVNRPINRFQALLSALFILLIINSTILFSIGAQLSFLAVFFIIWLYPKYKDRFESKYALLNKVWQMFLISLIAQLAVAPLLMYYFGTMSTVSTFTSLLGIPLVALIIGFGILLVLISPLETLFNHILILYEYLLSIMNTISEWFGQIPFSQIKVSIGALQLVLIYTLIIFVFSKELREKVSLLTSALFYRKV